MVLAWRRLLPGAAATAVLLVAVPVAVVLTRSPPAAEAPAEPALAWLATPGRGLVTLVDGSSGHVVGAVRVAPDPRLAVVPDRDGAWVVQPSAGTASRVDSRTYALGSPVRLGPAGAPVTLHPAGPDSWVVGPGVAKVDPASLAVRAAYDLPGTARQSVVDGSGRLWVLAGGMLGWYDRLGRHARPAEGGAAARLVLVGGDAALVDPARGRVGPLTGTGVVAAWSCLDLRANEPAELLGSTVLGTVLAAVPATGVLLGAGHGNDDCGLLVEVSEPGEPLGPLAESGAYTFVPNRATGHVVVVDFGARKVVADLTVAHPGAAIELVARGGVVFVNDPGSDRAAVLRQTGGRWAVASTVDKAAPVATLAPEAGAGAALAGAGSCALAATGPSHTVDLRAAPAGSLAVRLLDCPPGTRVLVRTAPLLSADPVRTGPGGVATTSVRLSGRPLPPGGELVSGAIVFGLGNGRTVAYDVLVNHPPVVSQAGCAPVGDAIRFTATVTDDQPSQGLTVTVAGRTWPMAPADPADPDRAWQVTVSTSALGAAARWQLRVRDGYGALTTVDRPWDRCR
jgi:hypothetical protein